LLDASTVIFTEEGINSARHGVTIERSSCITCNENIAASINRNSDANLFFTSHTQLTGELLVAIAVIFDDEEIMSAIRFHGITIQPTSCIAYDIDIVVGISRNSGGNSIFSLHALLLGV